MLNIAIPLFTTLVLTWIVHLIFRSNLQNPTQSKPFSPQILEWAKKFGKNSNSFMTLYPGLQYFSSQDPSIQGTIAFLDLSHTRIGGAEPLSDPRDHTTLLNEFAQTSSQSGKSAVLFPVSSEIAQKAVSSGFGSLMIGGEPTIDLKNYPPTGKTWIDVIPTAKLLDAKGALVVETHPDQCTEALRQEFEEITQEWLRSRKMDPLGFLNRVEPWTLSEHKRYFYIQLDGRILAFLAAIPIWPNKGWYLIDLIRRDDTPAGTTELLMLLSMKKLREGGALEITFGVSPLSLLDQVDSFPLAQSHQHPLLYRFFRFLYENGGFYNFKSLYQYKLKFIPSRIEPSFLIYKNMKRKHQKLGLIEVVNIFQAFSQKGILNATFSGVRRSLGKANLAELIKTLLKGNIVVRSAPKTWTRLLYRCKFTVIVAMVNLVLFFLTTDSRGHLVPAIEAEWGYTWLTFVHAPLHSLILSPFLHWNLLHLNFNLVALIFFVGGLEYLAGTGITVACYASAMIFSNPITSLALMKMGLATPKELDVGASLGIFGCGGALNWYFLKYRKTLVTLLCIITLSQSWESHHWIIMNHWTAGIIGVLIGFLSLRK